MKIKAHKISMAVLFILIGLFIGCVVFAEEEQEQKIDNDQVYFTPNIQKQPQAANQKQGITNHFTMFTVNVQINGKLDDIPADKK